MDLIGSGTYGKVYKSDGKAIKKFSKFSHFLDEYQMMKMLDDHPNIIKILSYDRIDKSITMELGKCSLQYYIHCEKNKNIKVKDIIDNMISAVLYLHQNNIAHLDLCPENFVVFDDCVKLIDFSLSIHKELFVKNEDGEFEKYKDGKLLQFEYEIPYQMCKIIYRPPELTCNLNNYFPAAVDVWSLECVIYEVLFEEKLFDNDLLNNSENFILAKLIVEKIGDYPEYYSEKFGNLRKFTTLKHQQKNNLFLSIKDDKYCELLSKMLIINAGERYDMEQIYEINKKIE